MSNTIVVTKNNGVALIKMNAPATRNAITEPEMLEKAVQAFQDIELDESIRVCVLTGVDKAFSSGGNVKDMLYREKMFAGNPLELQEGYRRGIYRLSKLMYAFEKPLIAAVNGVAVGAGFDLVLLCDIRIASNKARFASNFVNLGIIPGDGASWLLTKVVGAQRAAELVFTGRMLDTDEALDIGLLLKVVDSDQLIDEAMTLAESIASKPINVLRIAKRLLASTDRLSYSDHLDLCSANQAMLHHTPEHIAALEKFLGVK
ncbi:MAG: enoyl-CoA hydratase [Cycloclasticus sp. symbiont of Poecilosclerida sp. N]|nr:MAG: enoyl-CoA hydratase [Cycloclasticus sp. symbiont of Poecilosclerida sp. N]